METLMAIKTGEILLPVPIQIMFGGCPVDPELGVIFSAEPRWDDVFDEKLDARCAGL